MSKKTLRIGKLFCNHGLEDEILYMVIFSTLGHLYQTFDFTEVGKFILRFMWDSKGL